MTKRIVLIGGGGHCKACIDVLTRTGYEIAGIVDVDQELNVLGFPVIGNDDSIGDLAGKDVAFLVTVGQISSAATRKKIFAKVKSCGGILAAVISTEAIVSDHSQVGEGSIVMHGAVINAASVIGKNCIINTKALIEHDCIVEDNVHISTAAVINGGCRIGEGSFIGSNSVLVQGIAIGRDVIIGAGSVVVKNITEAGVYAGNPAKKI